jgi:hypothetical protein
MAAHLQALAGGKRVLIAPIQFIDWLEPRGWP